MVARALPRVFHLLIAEEDAGPLLADRIHEALALALLVKIVEAEGVAEFVGQDRRVGRVVDNDLPFLHPDPDQRVVGHDTDEPFDDRAQ